MADHDSRSGIRYADAKIIDWLNDLHAPFDAPLKAAYDSPALHDMPAIMIGASEGKFIELLLSFVGVNKVVEVGTLAAFSTIHLARSLQPDGHLWTIENESLHRDVAYKNLETAGLLDRTTIVLDDGPNALKSIEPNGPFDALFIDADKERYDIYGRWAAQHIRPGGLLLVDNAYFFGYLLDDRPDAAAVRRFHEEIGEHFDAVCIPTPDGLLMGRRR